MTLPNTDRCLVPMHRTKSHVYRQIGATFAASLLTVSGGITFGFTAVLLPQLEKDDNFPYDKSYDSWIGSIAPLAMIIGCLFAGTMSDMIGRRMGQIAIIIPFNIAWVIIGLSNNNAVMLLGRFITGICTGSTRPNTLVYIGELTDPRYRAIALFIPSIAIHVGSLISHVIGKYVFWKTACFLFTIPNFITLLLLIFLKESPLWLLNKGKINEGIESFRLFRGNGESSEKELAAILRKCREETEKTTFKDIANIIFSKPFIKSLAIVLFLFLAVQWCGVNTISFYAQEIFEKTFSGDVDAFLMMLATDSIRVIAGVFVCFIGKMIPRKTTFVACCLTTSLVLIAVVVYLYFHPVGFVWVGIVCMIAYISISSAISCIAWSFVAELFPLKVRGFGSGLTTAISFVLLFISVKVTPEVITILGTPVLYGGYAVITLISGVILIFMLPDTGGKSLQDIEDVLYKKKVQSDSNITKL